MFPSLVNDREDASYLIVLFYSHEILVAYSCCKVNKKGIYDFCLVVT